MTSPQDLHARGVRALNRGRHREARRLLEQARDEVRRTDAAPADLDARIVGSLAYVLSETGEHEAAMALCRDALRHGDLVAATEGVLHAQLGLLHMLRGETTVAMEEFDAALRLLDDPSHVARVHLNRGNVHLQRKSLDRATADFASSFSAYRDAGDEYGAAKAVHNRGYTQFLAATLDGERSVTFSISEQLNEAMTGRQLRVFNALRRAEETAVCAALR